MGGFILPRTSCSTSLRKRDICRHLCGCMCRWSRGQEGPKADDSEGCDIAISEIHTPGCESCPDMEAESACYQEYSDLFAVHNYHKQSHETRDEENKWNGSMSHSRGKTYPQVELFYARLLSIVERLPSKIPGHYPSLSSITSKLDFVIIILSSMWQLLHELSFFKIWNVFYISISISFYVNETNIIVRSQKDTEINNPVMIPNIIITVEY